MAEPRRESLLQALRPFGQEHVLAHWDRLTIPERASLAEQIAAIDWPLFRRLIEAETGEDDELREQSALAERAEPPAAMRLDGSGVSFAKDAAREAGRQALAAGKLGMMIVAGGLGTRLGFDKPKGMLPLAPVSGRTLFQIICEQVLAVSRRYRRPLPLYVMTSPATHAVTREFLAENRYFGLPAEDVRLFCQATLFAFDATTKRLLMESPGELFQGPDGHGGMLSAFARSGLLQDAVQRGIEQICYGQIDNPLTSICDPLLVGSHLLAGSEMTTQVIAKRDPMERVGNVVSVDGRTRMIEYIHFPRPVAERRNSDGTLRYWAGNVAVHLFDTAFLARSAELPDALPLHRALKKVPYVDGAGRRIQPQQPNAWRFERFIFDLLPAAKNALVVEGDRAKVFAPVKNADVDPTDNPRTARDQLSALHADWLRAAGVEIAPGTPVEINPLWALDAEETAVKIKPGFRITEPKYFSDL